MDKWSQDLPSFRFVTLLCFILSGLSGLRECRKCKQFNLLSWFSDDESNGDEQALLVLKDQISRYHTREERESLDELGRRLSEERLLSNAGMSELTDLYDRYNNGESLDSIVTSLRHPGLLFDCFNTSIFQPQHWVLTPFSHRLNRSERSPFGRHKSQFLCPPHRWFALASTR